MFADGEIIFLQRHKVQRILEHGAAFITVRTDQCSGLPPNLPPVVSLRVGRDILPRMRFELVEQGLVARMTFGGMWHDVAVPWQAVLRSELETPPNAPSGAPLQAVA